ncbi:ThuA domain-containing protein [Aliifodinibius sp. S!AR15-10]|uniref:ThuA domain-containing protein n=1 Tax=Aliifodinibius sp. S!AR15-10 TaxID=2950437 RepID=UPI002864F275|nr:ThuA domain-containing protein [Aliifodinibius sp. S!AR15-10]MDR8391973.1 ThuA domain-containing protein [Aliifodinibius sp. S!AR15-10]
MSKFLRLITAGVLILAAIMLTVPAHGQESISTLVITGAAPYGYHPWESNIELIEPRLETFGITDTEYHIAHGLEDWRKWEGSYSDYDAIVIIYYWSQAPEQELEKLDRYVRQGGALVVVHSALAGFWKQDIFDGWTGIAYRERDADYGHNLAFNKEGQRIIRSPGEGDGSAHAPIDTFRIETKDPNHPIMQGLPETWMQARDELYYNLRGPNTNIRVLAVAQAPDGTYAPQAWVRRHGSGRIFCLTPGHHAPGASSVGFITLLARGIEWAATGQVTTPIPTNFPGTREPITELPQFNR